MFFYFENIDGALGWLNHTIDATTLANIAPRARTIAEIIANFFI
jgi:hypothetical protein